MRANVEQIYSDIGFEDAAERVAATLAEQGWVAHARFDRDRDWETITGMDYVDIGGGYPDDGEWPWASVVASPFRTIADDYGDIVLRVRDGVWAEERSLLSHEDFPLAIQRELPQLGTFISLEPSRRYGRELAAAGVELCLQALNSGERWTRALQRTWSNDLIAINRGALEPGVHGVVPTIDALTQAVTQGQDLPLLAPTLFRPGLKDVVGDLHPRTQVCLRTAEMLAPLMVHDLDASAVIIQYTKAVEIELEDKILRPLATYWRDSPPDPKAAVGTMKRLATYLSGGRPLELGALAHTITDAFRPSATGDPVAESVRTIIRRHANPAWVGSDLPRELLELAATARNPAAHTMVLSPADLPRVRRAVLGDPKHAGVLERLLRPLA